MNINFTPLAKRRFLRVASRTETWKGRTRSIQRQILRNLLLKASNTEYGKKYGFEDIAIESDISKVFARTVPLVAYEDIRESVMRMIKGERDILWPGKCMNFAQSSGTTGGPSKFIPVTADSLRFNHYRGAEDAVAFYLKNVPSSKIFSGNGLILGGSFANTIEEKIPARVNVGDLSATLISKINPLVNHFRVPDKKTALISDWGKKLPLIIDKSINKKITNISGVPSWFLTVLQKILEKKGAESIKDVWPNLEVFFHGGISFEPYRGEYNRIMKGLDIKYLENYNASEGFFAVQNDLTDTSLLLLIDHDIYYEFLPVDDPFGEPLTAWEVEKGKIYELLITSSNGLWRYRLGDTVRIEETDPVKIKITGRTKNFINAFGEELMEENAERAVSSACEKTGASIYNYTVAPVYPSEGEKGKHEWLIEWREKPDDLANFSEILDRELRNLNSDYDAKRSGSIFLDSPQIISVPTGTFDAWLSAEGNKKLGGQRKIPRLQNNRVIVEKLLNFCK